MTVDRRERRILIVAGEASGDLHAANLIRAAREMDSGFSFFGVTGERMRAAGCETLVPSETIAVMGLVEVVRHLPAIRRAFRAVKATFFGPQRPDLLVLVDFPGFNMRLAKVAKKYGIPVLYYITPKVWAWKKKRARTLAHIADRLAVIFPFEPEIFRPFGANVEYVGNPLLDEYADYLQKRTSLRPYAVDGHRSIGLFPGSRRSEIYYNLETMLQTAALLKEKDPSCLFLMPLASSLDRQEIEQRIATSGVPVRLIADDIYGVAESCDAVLAVSGTVTLQVALAGAPLAVMYKLASLSYEVAIRVVKIPYVSLVNIVAGREVVREFIQDEARPEVLTAELLNLLDGDVYNKKVCDALADVRQKLGQSGCSNRVAAIVAQMTGQHG
jgi:lipid-A-disaccharide synthase